MALTASSILLTGHMSPGRTRGFDKNWRGQYQDPFLDLVEQVSHAQPHHDLADTFSCC